MQLNFRKMNTNKFIWGLLIFGLVFTVVITPVEAALFNQTIGWMAGLNAVEYGLFLFGMFVGRLWGKNDEK